MDAKGVFTDKNSKPSAELIRSTLGHSTTFWDSLIELLLVKFGTKSDMVFYGKNYGWAIRFKKGGKALASLYPGRGEFLAQIILSEAQVEGALKLLLSRGTRETIINAYPFPEGRWIFIRVFSKNSLRDAAKLIDLKSPSKKRI